MCRVSKVWIICLVYIRLIGDRSIDEKDFGKIQRNRISETQKRSEELKNVQMFEKNVGTAIVPANNPYADFGLGTVKIFREMMELAELTWEDKKDIPQSDDTVTEMKNRRCKNKNRHPFLIS